MRQAAAKREFTVAMAPMNGGTEIKVKGVVAFGDRLAMYTANESNPGYTALSARATKVLR